jgi:hypothetical protein
MSTDMRQHDVVDLLVGLGANWRQANRKGQSAERASLASRGEASASLFRAIREREIIQNAIPGPDKDFDQPPPPKRKI